jgi:hypothetical protein
MEGRGLDRSDSGQGRVTGCCEHGNVPSGSIKSASNCKLLIKDSASWSYLGT